MYIEYDLISLRDRLSAVTCMKYVMCNLISNSNRYISVYFFLESNFSEQFWFSLGIIKYHIVFGFDIIQKMSKITFNTFGLNPEASYIYYGNISTMHKPNADIDLNGGTEEKWKTIGILCRNRNMMIEICME